MFINRCHYDQKSKKHNRTHNQVVEPRKTRPKNIFSVQSNLLLALVLLRSSAPSWWWGSDFLVSGRSVADDSQVNSGRHAVVALVVDLWKSKLLSLLGVNASLAQISHTGGINHVTDDVLSDGLVLGDSSGTGLASNEFNVSSALLVSSVVSSLLGHFGGFLYIFWGFYL